MEVLTHQWFNPMRVYNLMGCWRMMKLRRWDLVEGSGFLEGPWYLYFLFSLLLFE
jgi:hypothetical protein